MRWKNVVKIGQLLLMLSFIHIKISYAGISFSERKEQLTAQEQNINNHKRPPDLVIDEHAALNDYIRKGLNNNPGLKAAFYRWKAAFKHISQAFSLPDPQFTFTEYIEKVETRVGPQQRAYMVKQKLPLPDTLWIRKSKAFKASEEAYYALKTKRQQLIYAITDAYYEYAYLSKAILLTEENIELLKNFEHVAQTQYTSGLTKNQDLLKAQVELGKLENDLYSLKDQALPLETRLKALSNITDARPLPWPQESLDDTIMEDAYADVRSLYDELADNNPDLAALEQNVEKHRDMVKLAKRNCFPDLTVGLTYIDTGNALNPATIDSGKDPLMLTFSVNVPLWFSRLHAGVEEAQASLRAAEYVLENKHNELMSQTAMTHYKLYDALRQSHLYKDALLPKATQTLNAVQSGYEGGKADFLSLIDAQRILLNFQLAYYRYNANFYQRLSELKMLLGALSEAQQ